MYFIYKYHILHSNMSTNTRITRSKGESDGLSLPMRTRPTRKETISGKDGGTALNTSCNAGLGQHHQKMPTHMPQLPTQSPQANPVRMMETRVLMLPPGQHRPLTPRTPLPTSPTSGSQPSQLSAPLFKEDRYSSTSEEETEADAEVTLINGRNQPNRTFVHNSTTEKPMSTLTTMDYTTQGDPNQVSPSTPLICSCQLLQKPNFLALTIFSFQMVATGLYIRSIIKFSMQVTWRMATMHIS